MNYQNDDLASCMTSKKAPKKEVRSMEKELRPYNPQWRAERVLRTLKQDEVIFPNDDRYCR